MSIKTQKNWRVVSNAPMTHNSISAEIISLLLKNRGLEKKEEIENFLYPKLEDISYKSLDIDESEVKKAVKRIHDGIAQKEQIIVYGDYDVDGITASAILWETLIQAGAVCMPYIPHRVDEGYGLSLKGIDNVLSLYPSTKIIITVDNGIVANKAVEYAKEKGIDVIITDHHMPDDGHTLPDCFALIHTTKLCGAGIAWLFSFEFKDYALKIDAHLELATLGTIADLVPLKDANRAIVTYGLPALKKTERKGLKSLYSLAEIIDKDITPYEVGHVIAPRLNAAGRLETAMDSLRLLCTKDPRRAQELAEQLDAINLERQKIMHDSTAHASSHIRSTAEKNRVLVIAHESYPEGVIGLIAGKLVEEYYRPSIVISKGEKVSKGSVRSIQGFDIITFLREHKEFFVNVGGHPMAAGFSIDTEKIELFQKTLEDNALQSIGDELLVRTLTVDCEIPLSLVTKELYSSLQQLAPFGMGNYEPLFISSNVLVREVRTLGREGKHLRFVLQEDDDTKPVEAVAFGLGEKINEVDQDDYINIVYTIDINTWKGESKLQLKIKDFKISSEK